jgi:hypothetical protein
MSNDECCGHHEIESIHSNHLSDLSETEQESLSGGFFYLYSNQREIFTQASNQADHSGSVTPSGGSGGSTVTGNFSGSSNSSYYLRESTFLLSSSTDVPFTVLPRLLKWLSSSM